MRLFDVYRWKQELYKAFIPIENGRPFLFDMREKTGNITVLLFSSTQPKVLPFGTWQTKKIPDNFYDGNRYLFELTANPTVKKAVFEKDGTKKKQGKREGLHPARYEEWLRRKFESSGCTVTFVTTENLGLRVCHHKGTLVSHSAARFKGMINVKNTQGFKKMALEGVGSARGFGFGMLFLKRV
jgi:CRISPR system Cascade subunit CasE